MYVAYIEKNQALSIRLRAGACEINITFSSCKQTPAFPIELPMACQKEYISFKFQGQSMTRHRQNWAGEQVSGLTALST